MNKNDFKKAINSIHPDVYLKTRLDAKVSEFKPKKKSRKGLVAAVSGVLCAIVVISAVSLNSGKSKPSPVDNNNQFVMLVNAAQPAENAEYKQIDKNRIILPNHQLSWEEQEGSWVLCENAEYDSDFVISGKNIKSVKYSCISGSLVINYIKMAEYLNNNAMLYDIVVPKEVGDKMNLAAMTSEEINKRVKNGEFDEYFKGKAIAKGGYAAFWDIYAEDNYPGYKSGYGLVSNENMKKIYPYHDVFNETGKMPKEYIFENILKKSENIAYSGWSPDTSKIEYNGEYHFSKVPQDTLTVEITYNNGSKEKASYLLSYSDDGNLSIKQI